MSRLFSHISCYVRERTVYAKWLWFIPALFVLTACATDVVVTPPPEEVRAGQDREMLKQIAHKAVHGDWLVICGYHATDHLVSTATNIPLSHAAILDMQKRQVIEADASGVHITSLADFVHKSHRLLVIHPIWSDKKSAPVAVGKARALVGEKYDFLGTVGINDRSRYYCSELTIYAYSDFQHKQQKIPHVVEPGQLYLWGQVVYDSRPRDEME